MAIISLLQRELRILGLVVKEESSCQLSNNNASIVNLSTNKNIEEISQKFESRVHVNDEEDLHISDEWENIQGKS